ncbi:MAG: malectin domain-containing carbohydrate-binding protein [Candidatus Acidiferrum sp.]
MQKVVCLLVLALASTLPAAAQTPIRVNCGGPSYTDAKSQVWQADSGFSGGAAESSKNAVAGTSDPVLYDDYRWNPTSYSFQVPNGQYQLNLYFDEANPKAEKISGRVFNVSMQGNVVFPELDIFAAAGANAALIKSANVSVTNGTLAIGFTRVAGLAPEISAIEILPASNVTTGPALNLNFTYADGTPVSGTLNYTLSSSLLNFQGSQPLVNGVVQCQLFANPSSMGISAQFQVTLSLTDTAGNILWQMSVGMNPAQVNLGGVQSSSLNVVVQKMQ